MKILFIFTGGTIGSTLTSDDVIATDARKPYRLLNAYSKKYEMDFEYDISEPYSELSENNTGEHIRRLSDRVRSDLNKGYDGIIVTHGTDTLQYSAAALGYMVGLASLPICLVSSNYPIEHPDSNALDNLRAAISFIRSGAGRGVFVPYRNDRSNAVHIHRATRLIGPKAFSGDILSIFEEPYGCFDEAFNFVKNEKYLEKPDEMEPLDLTGITESSNGIAVIHPYPGMVYPQISDDLRYIILNTYHSGTINTKAESTNTFLRLAREKGIKMFVTGVTEGPMYESSTLYEHYGLIGLTNMSPIAAYVKLWILMQSDGNIEKQMMLSLSGDIAP